MDDIKGLIVGGIVVLVIGGTGFAINQADVVQNFAEETGMSEQQAQRYVEDTQGNLESFSVVGQEFIDDGNYLLGEASSIDCINYVYEWEGPGLSCSAGKGQLQAIANSELKLGSCFKALDEDLGNTARSKISECITHIDTLNATYDLPIAVKLLDSDAVTEIRNTNIYNKSVLRAALEAE